MTTARDDLAAKIKDAYYHARDHGGTMHTAADDAADAIIAAGWVPAERDAVGVMAHLSREVSRANAERDALAATVARVRELCDLWGLRARSGRARVDSAECERELRAALAPSDPATDTGGEDRG